MTRYTTGFVAAAAVYAQPHHPSVQLQQPGPARDDSRAYRRSRAAEQYYIRPRAVADQLENVG